MRTIQPASPSFHSLPFETHAGIMWMRTIRLAARATLVVACMAEAARRKKLVCDSHDPFAVWEAGCGTPMAKLVGLQGQQGQQEPLQGRCSLAPCQRVRKMPHLGCGPERVGVGPEVDHIRISCGRWSRGVYWACAGRVKKWGEGVEEWGL